MNTDDKIQLFEAILTALQSRARDAEKAMNVAHESATHEESIAENQYDTLGLEAAYLAEGQSRRLIECQKDLTAFKEITPRRFSEEDPISIGALIQLQNQQGQSSYFFLGPAAGGLKIQSNQIPIMVITPSAPLAKALLDRHIGDEITLNLERAQQHYEIIALF